MVTTDMLIEGHYEVLDDLALARPDVYDGWPLMRSRADLLRALRLGIAYPDMPCGKERLSRRTGRVRVVKFRLCSSLTMLRTLLLRRSIGVRTVSWLATPSIIASTVGLVHGRPKSRTTRSVSGSGGELDMDDPYQLIELYQSHLGTQAHLHAMSPGLGDATVGEVTHRIVRQLLILGHRAGEAALAGDRSYAHWLGMMLHVLTDSYTPGHVIRFADAPLVLVLVSAHEHAKQNGEKDPVIALDGALYRLAKATADSPHSPRAFRRALPSLVSSSRPGASRLAARVLYHAYLRYVMHHQTDAQLHALIPDLRGEYGRAAAAATAARHGSREYDVINYSHYDSQPAGYHLLHDRLELLRERPALYRRMLDECAALLDLFKLAFKEKAPQPSRRRHLPGRILLRGEGSLPEPPSAPVLGPLMESVMALLAARPFRVRSARDAAAPAGARYV